MNTGAVWPNAPIKAIVFDVDGTLYVRARCSAPCSPVFCPSCSSIRFRPWQTIRALKGVRRRAGMLSRRVPADGDVATTTVHAGLPAGECRP